MRESDRILTISAGRINVYCRVSDEEPPRVTWRVENEDMVSTLRGFPGRLWPKLFASYTVDENGPSDWRDRPETQLERIHCLQPVLKCRKPELIEYEQGNR